MCIFRYSIAMGVLALALQATVSASPLERLLAPVEIRAQEPAKASIELAVPEKAIVPQVYAGEDLLRDLRAQLCDHYSLAGDLDLELPRSWGGVRVNGSEAPVLTVLEFPREGISSSFAVRCRLSSGSQVVGEWTISLRARLRQEVWVAAVRLERGQALEESLLNAQKVDVLANRAALLGTDCGPSRLEMSQGVNAGTPITKRDVLERPVIRKNQIVEAVANRGALAITMKAQALENGSTKALIRMRNLDSKREFVAQVIDETRVAVIF